MTEENKLDIDSTRKLFLSICVGLDVKTIRSLLHGIDIDVRDSEGNTPLLVAGIHERKNIFKLLIESGANINICTRDKRTVLHYASKNGWEKIVRYLVEKGQDLNAIDIGGDTAMHYASRLGGHLKVVQYLIKKGADCERNNLAGYTPLLCAAEGLSFDVYDLLRNNGANIDDSNGRLLLYCAVQNSWRKAVHHLLNRVPSLNEIFRMDGTTFDPSPNKHLELVKLLVGEGTVINVLEEKICRAALYYASSKGHLEVVKWLVKEVPGFRARDYCGEISLQVASFNGHLEVLKCLLETGTDVNARQQDGDTALHAAVQSGSLEVVQCLLESGIDIEAKDNLGRTALYLASVNGDLEVVKCLVEKGADMNGKCISGTSPIRQAAIYDHKDVVAFFIDLGANVNLPSYLSTGTILHLATQNMWSDVVKSLIERGCELDARNGNGATALINALFLEQMDIAQALLQAGARWDIEDKYGKSSLHYLTMTKEPQIKLIKLLVENGAHFKPAVYNAIVKSSSLEVLKDIKLCCQVIVNKFNNYDFPELYKLLGSERLPQIVKMKVKSDSEVARAIERTVEFEIHTKGHCNILKVRPTALSVISVSSLLEYCKKKSGLNTRLKRPAASDFSNSYKRSSKSMCVHK